MKSFITGLFLLSSIFSFSQMAHVDGQLLVQFTEKADPQKVLENYREVNGESTGITLSKLVSEPMNIFLVTFNALENEQVIKRALSNDPEVSICQFNHYVSNRETVPNDPMIDAQWHHINNDNNGGTNDADIDSDLAWDVTTGGLTAAGDTIVVCVIEGGNLNHPDLIDNAWFNYNEIPNNGIDDDANGYVDDFKGWNVNSESDDGVYQGGHGTNVMGMIGATGNNDLGVVGANWNVKIMSVAGESVNDELSVVAAYTYALKQRQEYDASNGELGAFVVATNASWGIDGGDPDDVPIWSQFYDTLGLYGILNCGATANNNVNIDIVGDIPTAAESNYMISVTATNFNDVRTFSGYGAETIDLGAPGENVTTTAGNNGYTSTSGTSFASPLTAGVIGLMYSIPCPSFIEAVHANPQYGADYVRQMLFDGVDPIDNLEFETVTGGRLNANNSIMLMMGQCGGDDCLPPLSFDYSLTADTIYTFGWTIVGESHVVMRLRQIGNETWSYIETNDTSSVTIDSLANCVAYEFEIANNCDAEPIEDLVYSNYMTLETMGCCIPTENVTVTQIENTSAEVFWDMAFAIPAYEVYYRILGDLTWEYAGSSDNGFYLLDNLLECNEYEVNILPDCSEDILFGTISLFRTKGCGACLDEDYCPSYAESSDFEFIDKVEIDGFINESGDNGGFAFFESLDIELEVAATYDAILTPGFDNNAYSEFFTLWIDLDQNGEFDSNEILLQSENGSVDALSGSIEIPASTPLGATRLRVQMKYVGNNGPGSISSCDIVNEGEIEDYCITILDSTVGLRDASQNKIQMTLFPNPNKGSFTVKLEGLNQRKTEAYTIVFYDLVGKRVANHNIQLPSSQLEMQLNTGL